MKTYVIMETSGLKVLSCKVYNNVDAAFSQLKDIENKYLWTKRYGRYGEVVDFNGLNMTYEYTVSKDGDKARASIFYNVIES